MFRSLLSQQYLPLRQLAEGGMGEIFLARQLGEAGFQREVVVKRVHRQLAESSRALEIFLDETRQAARLGHPNIVQIFDVGEEDGRYQIVMERVHGPSLRELAEANSRRGQMIPMELSLTIIAQVLEGLRHAHAARDESGRPLQILHRDVSPGNVLLSLDGIVKLVDFGVARAERELQREPLPARFAYMSPEAVRGEPLDSRSDLFSVGVLLYELTVGQRLFRAASFEELRRVVDGPVPPPTYARAGYPVDLEILVMRALEGNPEDRFADAEAMLDGLEQFAFDTNLRLSRLRLARFLGRLLGGRAAAELEDPVEEGGAGETAGEDLDFDHRGLFGRAQLPLALAGAQVGERARHVREAVEQANQAIAELVGSEEPEEGHTLEMRISDQAVLRARSLDPEPPGRPEGSQTGSLRDGSALVVTDELVEEELDLADPGADLLREPPLAEVITEQELDLEDLPTGPRARGSSRSGGLPRVRVALAEAPPALPDDDEVEPARPPGQTGATGREATAASADLIEALAEISAELRAAEASDRRREEALVQAMESLGGDTPLPLHRTMAVAPPPAAVPPPPGALPPPLLLGRPTAPPPGPLTSIAPVRDELEAADGPSRRTPDDLELSDFEERRTGEQPEEELELEADGETIIIDPEHDSLLQPVRSGQPAPPPLPELSPSPPPTPPTQDQPAALAAQVSATDLTGPLQRGAEAPGPDLAEEPAAGAAPDPAEAAVADDDDDEGLDGPTLVQGEYKAVSPERSSRGQGKRRRKGKRRR